jgi:REP-associated tyrosine transposase
MRQVNSVYTQLFNKRHGRTGHLFQGRYKAILIQKDSHLLEVCRYVVLNPVRAKMVERPEDHAWSSYLATAGKARSHTCLTTDWVLRQFSGKRSRAEQEYRKFVQWGIGQKTIWTEVRGQALLGEDGFMDKMVDHLKKHKDIPEIPRSQRYANRPALTVLFPEGIVDDPRKLLKRLAEAVERHGYRQSEIARQVGVHYSTISRWLREYENARRKT